jgi:hypothetical protein
MDAHRLEMSGVLVVLDQPICVLLVEESLNFRICSQA